MLELCDVEAGALYGHRAGLWRHLFLPSALVRIGGKNPRFGAAVEKGRGG